MSQAPPPPPGGPKNPPKGQDPDPAWDNVLATQPAAAISPDLARKLLQMNPKLREDGMSTGWMVTQAQQAAAQAARGARPASEAAAKPGSDDVLQAVVGLAAQLDKDERALDLEIKTLQERRGALKTQTRETLTRWLLERDPDLRSPVTQQVLVDEKPFLDRIAFSVKGYVEHKRQALKK